MAIEIQCNLLFRARCWYCYQDPIFLFAAANAGFAIFNEVGRPWEKHDCPGYRANPRCLATTEMKWDESWDVPVPYVPTNEVEELIEGMILGGTIVSVAEKPEYNQRFKHWPAAICTGSVLYRLNLDEPVECGNYITGVMHRKFERVPYLTDVKPFTPDKKALARLQY